MATHQTADPIPTISTTLPTLRTALMEVERDVAEFFGSPSPEVFAARIGEAWSPAEHLSHLNIAVSAVARGFSVPPRLLRLRFGRARRPSRSYEALRDDYFPHPLLGKITARELAFFTVYHGGYRVEAVKRRLGAERRRSPARSGRSAPGRYRRGDPRRLPSCPGRCGRTAGGRIFAPPKWR